MLTLRGPNGPRRGTDLQNLGIIPDGAVLIVDGLIREVGPTRRLENLALARNAREIDASGRVVMPGFVDAHAHLAGGAGRPVRELSPRTLEAMALRALEEAVRHGTTAVEAKSGFGVTDLGETKILRAHGALREFPLTVVSTLVATPDAGLESALRLLAAARRRKLAEFAEINCGGGGGEEPAFTPAEICAFLSRARELDWGVKMNARGGAGSDAIAMALEAGVRSVSGLECARECDAALLGRADCIATLLPGVSFSSGGERYAPARLLLEQGAALVLGTGYRPGGGPSQSMPAAIALASRMLRMTAAEAIAAATINAAHALGRAATIGSIESGKRADLVMLSVPDYRELPYHFGVNLVDLVMSEGRVLAAKTEVQWPVL